MDTKLKSCIFILLILLLLPGNAVSAQSPHIRYQVDDSYPPFEYRKENKLYGFDLELADYIFMGGGYDIEYSSDHWEAVYGRLVSGEIDTCGLVAINEDRKADILFTKPVLRTYAAVYSTRNLGKMDIRELKSYRIGVGNHDYCEGILKNSLHITNYHSYDNYLSALEALKAGNIDVVFGNQEVINYILIENKLKGEIIPQLTNLYPVDFAYGVKKGNTELVRFMDNRLDMLKKSGVYEEVYQKFFYVHSHYYFEKMIARIIIILLLIITGVIVIAMTLHMYIKHLRKKLCKVNEEVQRQNEWMNLTFSGLSAAVIITDADGNITYRNKTAERLGHIIKGEGIYDFVFDIINDPDVSCMDIEKQKKLDIDTGRMKLIVDPENHNILAEKDGIHQWYYYYSAAVKNEDGQDIGYVMIFHDVTESKQARLLRQKIEENMRLLNETVEFDKLKTEFFSNISHELKTPLNVILGTQQVLELYLKDNIAPDKMENINRYKYIMKQNCLRLLRLVNNLIDITKIDSGFFEINLSNNNIISVVEETVMSVAQYIEQKSISVIFDTEAEEKLMACDPDKIERIVLNLLSNAVKFTKPGGSIMVNIKDKGEDIIISVKDTGIGIPKDKQKLIFERFKQIKDPLVRNTEGSGIGLSLVKSLTEMHGGKVYLESEYGVGSEFIIELPVTVLPQTDDGSESANVQTGYVGRADIEFSDICM